MQEVIVPDLDWCLLGQKDGGMAGPICQPRLSLSGLFPCLAAELVVHNLTSVSAICCNGSAVLPLNRQMWEEIHG